MTSPNNKTKKLAGFFSAILLFAGFLFLTPVKAQAICPMCTFAVGAGLGVSRWLGIDDIIPAIWIGALAFSSGLWLAGWVKQKDWNIPKKEWLAAFSFHLLLIPTLYALGIAGNPLNTLWGVDKIMLGVVVGTITFGLSGATDKYLRSINEEKVFIYYQKVILPMLYLSVVSFIFHLIVN